MPSPHSPAELKGEETPEVTSNCNTDHVWMLLAVAEACCAALSCMQPSVSLDNRAAIRRQSLLANSTCLAVSYKHVG